jgi:plastocyanin
MRIIGGKTAAAWSRVMTKGVHLLRLVAAFVLLPLVRTSLAQPPAGRVDWSHAQPINVLMVDSKFIPDRLTFRHGTPYQLHLENHGHDLHEFTAPAFLGDSIVRDPAMLANGGQEIVLQPGASADVDLVPLKPGRYPLICADHDWADMIGEITVE